MGTTTGRAGSRVAIFGDSIVRSRDSLLDLKFANHANPAFCPPDVAILVDRNHVRGQAAGWIGTYRIFQHFPFRRMLADTRHRAVIFGEPDIIFGIDRDAVGLAISRGSDKLRETMGRGIEAANLIREMFREPDDAMMIDGDIPWSGVGGGNLPLRECIGAEVKHAKHVSCRHGKPEIAARVECQEQRLSVSNWEIVGGDPVRRRRIVLGDDARRRRAAAGGGRVAARNGDPHVPAFIERCPPGVRPGGNIKIRQ